MNKNNAFDYQRCDLGTSSTNQVGKTDIDLSFRQPYKEGSPCIFCTNTAHFRIIPKEDKFNTAEVQDKGYICNHCATKGFLDKEHYGLRPINKQGGIV